MREWLKQHFKEDSCGRNALHDSGRNLLAVLVIVGVAAAGLRLTLKFNDWHKDAEEEKHQPYRAKTLLAVLEKEPSSPPTDAVRNALKQIDSRQLDTKFASREDILAAVQTIVVSDPSFPTEWQVIDKSRKKITDKETEITAVENRKAAKDAEKKAEDERVLERLLRDRDFLIDQMRMDVATVHEQQALILSAVTASVDTALVSCKKIPVVKPNGESTLTVECTKAADTESPLHVPFEAARYLFLTGVVLAIGFCATVLLKLLPLPGMNEKGGEWIKELFNENKSAGGEKSSSVGSILFTTAIFGVSAFAAVNAVREQPGGLLHGANLGDLLPAPRAESLSGRNAGIAGAGGSPIIVQPTPLNASFNPTINSLAYQPVYVPEIKVPQPKVENVDVHGLEGVVAGVQAIGQKTDATLQVVQNSLSVAQQKTDHLEALITQQKGELETSFEKSGDKIRNSMQVSDFNGEQRWQSMLYGEAVDNSHHWWRRLLALSKYQATDKTRTVFAAEPSPGPDDLEHDADLHTRLTNAITNLASLEPTYSAPFQESLLLAMYDGDRTALNKNRDAAYKELHRHLPVILQSSRVAE